MLAVAKVLAIKSVNEGFSMIIWNRHNYIPEGSNFYIKIIYQDLERN